VQSKETISFLETEVEIVLRHGRRHLTIKLHPEKPLRVLTNLQTSQKAILNFLFQKKDWIEKHLSHFRETEKKVVRPQMVEGSHFPYLGEMKYLHFSVTPLKRFFFSIEEGYLVGYVPIGKTLNDFSETELWGLLTHFYKREASKYLTERLKLWSEHTGLKPTAVKFRAQQTRWGSCSSKKSISLNWKLVCHSPSLIDYVIVHELCHLKHMNHSADFWSLVESFFPSYEEVEKILKEQERLSSFLIVSK